MGSNKNSFLKVYDLQTKSMNDPNLDELDRKVINIERSGGFWVYKILHKSIVRNSWRDTKEFPLKEKYYDNNYLVCCFSVRQLCKMTGFGSRKIQQLLKDMEEVGWIIKDNQFTFRGQNVYILGKWSRIFRKVDNNIITLYQENLFYNEIDNETTITETSNDNYESRFNIEKTDDCIQNGYRSVSKMDTYNKSIVNKN